MNSGSGICDSILLGFYFCLLLLIFAIVPSWFYLHKISVTNKMENLGSKSRLLIPHSWIEQACVIESWLLEIDTIEQQRNWVLDCLNLSHLLLLP